MRIATGPGAALRMFGSVPLALALATGAALGADRDNDGLRDDFEVRYGVTSPDLRDSDWDGVVDGAEDSDGDRLGNLAEQRFKLNPAKRDTDGDGTPDGLEDHDRDGRSNNLEQYQLPVPARLIPSLDQAPGDLDETAKECAARLGSAAVKRCRFGPTGTGRRVALLGDSHAMVMTTPMRRVARTDRFRLVTYLKGGCPPALGIMSFGQHAHDGGKSCRTWRLNAIRAINANPPDLLVVTASDGYRLMDGDGGIMPKEQRPARWQAGMERLIDRIPPGTTVLILGDAPQNWKHSVTCLRKYPGNMARCTSRWQPMAQRAVERAWQRAAENNAEAFATLYGKVCPTDPCPQVQGATLVWRDKSHLTATFARKLTPSVRRTLRPFLD